MKCDINNIMLLCGHTMLFYCKCQLNLLQLKILILLSSKIRLRLRPAINPPPPPPPYVLRFTIYTLRSPDDFTLKILLSGYFTLNKTGSTPLLSFIFHN